MPSILILRKIKIKSIQPKSSADILTIFQQPFHVMKKQEIDYVIHFFLKKFRVKFRSIFFPDELVRPARRVRQTINFCYQEAII